MSSTSFTLLRHQGQMLNTVANILKNSFKSKTPNLIPHSLVKEIHNIIPNEKVVSEYHKWLGASQKYPCQIAPHLFPLWSYPHLFKLGESLNLPLHKVLNQGCKMVIENPIPINSPLNTKIELFEVKEFATKFRINQAITTSTKESPNALTAEIYAVILKDTKANLSKETKPKIYNTEGLTFLKNIGVTKEDAQSYAYLSGDVNPIHLSRNIAKFMGLKGSIMHGFGLFAMVFEELNKAGFQISEIDVRFLNPVYLNSQIKLFIQQLGQQKFQLKVFSADLDTVHLSGSFQVKEIFH